MIRSLILTLLLLTAVVVGGLASPASGLDDTPWYLPEMPPRCTVAEANSGDVGHCMLAFYEDPSTTGWGRPPAPGVGAGWSWTGSNYNGSDALARWEDERIAQNTTKVASMWPGSLETHVAAQPLFEGFLREITLKGYEVGYTIGYSFRCTSGNGGWNCPSGDADDLSFHAWGLAIDMNSETNPIRTYRGEDGATACKTPIVTDMPRWMIQTAERWGLYWGGYGWNNGCQTVDSQRSSVFRDPPHFEFRGTVDQARAIAAFNEGRLPPPPRPDGEECWLTVDHAGDEVERCNTTGTPGAGWRLPIDSGVPDGTTAVMINLTATETASAGFLTLEDCAPRSGPRETSALSFGVADTVAAMAVVPVDDSGRFCVYRNVAADSIVDVLGYLGDDGEPLWFDPDLPTRLTDTRRNGACAPLQECRSGPLPGGHIHYVPTKDHRPLVANLTVVDGAAPGYLQAGTCDRIGEDFVFSNLNHADGNARANLALVDNGADGSCVYALSDAHVIVDGLGSLDESVGYGWHIEAPRRVLDTRECSAAWCDARPGADTVIEVDLGTKSPGAAVAVTVTDAAAAGFVTVAPCSTFVDGEAVSTSNVNHLADQTATNLALVDLDDGRLCIYTLSPAHLIIDVQAELTEAQEIGLVPVDPTRVHDSRE